MTFSMCRIALFLCLGTPSPARRTAVAAPQVIVLNGGPLHHRILLTDYAENHQLMLATGHVVQVSPDSLRVRPRIRVAMYWGFQWKGRTDLPDTVSAFAVMNGAQAGTLYPAWRGRSALLVVGPAGGMPASTRMISAAGLAILISHDIPVAIEEPRERHPSTANSMSF